MSRFPFIRVGNSMKKFVFVFILLIGVLLPMRAQNLPYADQRPFHFGFSLGLNFMDLALTPSMLPCGPNGEVLQARVSSLMPGFSVGVIGEMRLNRYFSVRTHPTFHFGQRTISYKPDGSTKDDPVAYKTDVISMPIMVPFYLKYSAEREWNGRPYILLGGGVSFDVGRDRERYVILNTFDYFLEVGVGCEIYFSFFKLSPELKFSLGFNNVLTPISKRPELNDPAVHFYTNAIDRLTSRLLTLSFNFE